MASEGEETAGLAQSEALYWRLKAHLQVEFQRHLEAALAKLETRMLDARVAMEQRIIDRIDSSAQASLRQEDRQRDRESDHEARIRELESGLDQTRGMARLLMWAVPLGFTVMGLLSGVLSFLRP